MAKKIVFYHYSKSFTYNPYPLLIWEHLDFEQKREYYSNYWIKCKKSHSLHEGYQPYVSIYNRYKTPKSGVYVRFFGKQAKLFQTLDQAFFYVEKQYDTAVMDDYDFTIFDE